MKPKSHFHRRRKGTTAVETAAVLPIFFLFLFGLFEVGRAMMLNNMLQASCRHAARYGAAEGVTSEQVEDRVRQYMKRTVDTSRVTVVVKDATVYDTEQELPEDAEDFEDLPDIELSESESPQLFLVRASVNYNDAAFLPLRFMDGATLVGQSITRHE